jgi:hypothetical protein
MEVILKRIRCWNGNIALDRCRELLASFARVDVPDARGSGGTGSLLGPGHRTACMSLREVP